MNNNTQESKIQLEYINKCTELVKEKYEKAPAFFIQNAGCQMNSLQTDTVAGQNVKIKKKTNQSP